VSSENSFGGERPFHGILPAVQPGQLVAEKYQVERVLGQGGMGLVVAALHLQLQQRVAIKVLLPEAMRREGAVERFLREARAAVQLRSEHVGRVLDVGTLDTGEPFMVMEFLEGSDLADLLLRRGPLPVDVAADFLIQACEALADAHALGIVHRDVKPANLFITRRSDGSPMLKVLDFGISKAAAQTNTDFKLTQTSTLIGSPGYMSPEQLRSAAEVDARTDIWSLGVVLYELLAGKPPFTAMSFSELCLKVVSDPLPPMPAAAPPRLQAVIARCLERDPDRRYRHVAELASVLAPFGPPSAYEAAQRIGRVLAQQPGASKFSAWATTVGPTTMGGAAGEVDGDRLGRRLGLWIAAGAVIAAGIVGATMLAGREPAKGAEPATAGAPAPVPAAAARRPIPEPVITPLAEPAPAAAAAAPVAPADPTAAPAAGPTRPRKPPAKPGTPATAPAASPAGATPATSPGDEDVFHSRY